MEEIQVVKIRITEGQESPGGWGADSSSGGEVGEVGVAIGEGGQDAIGCSFPSSCLLSL